MSGGKKFLSGIKYVFGNEKGHVNPGGNKKSVRLPVNYGKWVGSPGNGEWYSDKKKVLEITKGEPVIFKDGRPDFSKWSKGSINFDKGVLNGTSGDFDEVYIKLAATSGFKNKTAAKKWLKDNGLTPHHLSNTIIQLIPTKLHGDIPHAGFASDMRKGL